MSEVGTYLVDVFMLAEITNLPELNATGSRDFGRGYSQAIRDVLSIIERTRRGS